MSIEKWYAVKCLFSHPDGANDGEMFLYEERTTLWKAASFEEAFEMAEREAEEYVRRTPSCEFIQASDGFHLYETEIGHGSEIWSQMRGSNMAPKVYLDTFCCTQRDRVGDLDDKGAT